jgi:hypothetical protein
VDGADWIGLDWIGLDWIGFAVTDISTWGSKRGIGR